MGSRARRHRRGPAASERRCRSDGRRPEPSGDLHALLEEIFLGLAVAAEGKTGRAEREEKGAGEQLQLLVALLRFPSPSSFGFIAPSTRGPTCREPIDGPETEQQFPLACQEWSVNDIAGWPVAMGLDLRSAAVCC